MNSKEVNKINKDIWESNAQFWDDYMGADGNDWHQILVAPYVQKLLDLKEGDQLLDLGCGNGVFSRRMAANDVSVTGIDFSSAMVEKAKSYGSDNIVYRVGDATDESLLKSLAEDGFHGVVANMVLMDVPDIKPLFKTMKDMLKEKGVFVFAIQHPCFNSEFVDWNKENVTIQINNYIEKSTSMGVAIEGQEKDQYYFHRPIQYYMQLGFENGMLVDGFEEPVFDSSKSALFSKFPPVLVVRMRRA